jgi:hypothetical protein
MKKLFIFKLLLILLLLPACDNTMNELEDRSDSDNPVARGGRNYIRNANFEKPIDFNVLNNHTTWIKEGWQLNLGLFNWAATIGRNNTGGISLEAGNGVQNDIAVTQMIRLNPHKFYRLSAWVKTENVVGGMGANICLYGTWSSSGALTGTADWQEISFDFVPPLSGEVTIGCRLGYWAGISSGKAYFDDVVIEEVPKFDMSGQHVRLILDQEDASAVHAKTLKAWIANLDKAYEQYYELMGAYPYSGETITILSVDNYPGGWAVAGNPILWYKPYIKSELQNIEATGSWSFGIMHELGHDFALTANRSWIWHEEMFANFRMYYVVEQLNAPISLAKFYVGAELKFFYKTDVTDGYDNGIAQGIPIGQNGLMYTLIRIKDQIGWDPFINAIGDLNASSVAPATNWERFNLFLDKLTQYSGQDVRATYPAGELDVIKQLLQ